jgi:hypothetical protein
MEHDVAIVAGENFKMVREQARGQRRRRSTFLRQKPGCPAYGFGKWGFLFLNYA